MNVHYFESPGELNTEEVIEIVKKRSAELEIKHLLVPSVRGVTAANVLERLARENITLFFVGTNPASFSEDTKKRIESAGFKLVFYKDVNYAYPDDMKNAFRRFGAGTKVAVELALIAAQEEAIPPHTEVISLGGTAQGLDTALVIMPARSSEFDTLEVREVLCKPRKLR